MPLSSRIWTSRSWQRSETPLMLSVLLCRFAIHAWMCPLRVPASAARFCFHSPSELKSRDCLPGQAPRNAKVDVLFM